MPGSCAGWRDPGLPRAPCPAAPARRGAHRGRGGGASEADEAVLERLAAAAEPLSSDELRCALPVDTAIVLDVAALAAAWRAGSAQAPSA